MMNTALLALFTLFSSISFLGILFGANPYESGKFTLVLFFLTLFFSLVGVFALLWIFISKIVRKPFVFETVFRRAFLLAALATSVILFETFSILNIWNAFAAFLLIVSIEMLAAYKK